MSTKFQNIKLTEIATFFDDGNWIESKDQSAQGFWLVQTGNVGVITFREKEIKRFVSEETFRRLNCTEVLAGDILISRLPDPVGRSCIIPKTKYRLLTAVDCTILRLKPEYDNRFINYLINSEGTRKQVYRLVTGSSRKRISRKNLGTVELPIPFRNGKPDLAEQRRIADKLDRVAVEVEKGMLSVSTLKKEANKVWYSLTQKLFSLSDFQKVKIGICCEVMTGGTPRRAASPYWGGDVKWMASGDINKRRIFDVEGRITQLGLEKSNAKILPAKSVMVALNGQGKTRGMVAITEIELTCNQSLAAIVPKPDSYIDPEYLFWNLYSRYKEIRYIRGGEFRSGLNLDLIRQIEFPVPIKNGAPNLTEQKRIASEIRTVFEMSEQLTELVEKQQRHFSALKISVLNQEFKLKSQISTEHIQVTEDKTPRVFDIQQAIAQILKRFERGEMVIAKVLYLGQALFGVPTNIQFSAQDFGPYDVAVKKAVTAGLSPRNKFFTRKGNSNNQVLTLGVNSTSLLKYDTSHLARKTNEYLDVMLPLFNKSDSAGIERLATLCKIIEDLQTTEETVIKTKLQEWKPNKFTEAEVNRSLAFIKEQGWGNKLLNK